MHHLIHVLQRGRVICASHIAVFETIVKDLSAGPAASEKESISREFKMPGVSVQDPAVQDPSATTDQSLSPQSKAHQRLWYESGDHGDAIRLNAIGGHGDAIHLNAMR